MRKVTHTSIELIADEGMVLTDGKRYVKAVLLPYTNNGEGWVEVPEIKKTDSVEDKENTDTQA